MNSFNDQDKFLGICQNGSQEDLQHWIDQNPRFRINQANHASGNTGLHMAALSEDCSRYVFRYGTIHLRRRQIFTIFDFYPPPVGNCRHSSKMTPPLPQLRRRHFERVLLEYIESTWLFIENMPIFPLARTTFMFTLSKKLCLK